MDECTLLHIGGDQVDVSAVMELVNIAKEHTKQLVQAQLALATPIEVYMCVCVCVYVLQVCVCVCVCMYCRHSWPWLHLSRYTCVYV